MKTATDTKGACATVSILMSTYNRAQLLERSLNSLLTQNYTDYELIVIDDGSTDDTFEVVDTYIDRFSNCIYVKHNNRRSPTALNTGLRLAQGQYITFLDSDDEYLSDHLSLRLAFMEDNPDADLIYGGLEIIGNPFVRDKDDLSRWIPIESCVPCATIFARQEVFDQLRGFRNLPYAHDTDFVERANQKAFTVCKVHYPTYRYYRDSDDSVCNQIGA